MCNFVCKQMQTSLHCYSYTLANPVENNRFCWSLTFLESSKMEIVKETQGLAGYFSCHIVTINSGIASLSMGAPVRLHVCEFYLADVAMHQPPKIKPSLMSSNSCV